MSIGPIRPAGSDAGSGSSSGFERLAEFDPSASLATQQVEEMVAAWRRGEPKRVEEFLAREPGLGDEAVIRLIFEECCLGEEAGLAIDRAELAQRFPRWWPDLEVLLDCRQTMQAGAEARTLPAVGERLAEFRLLAELGQGVSGKVYLASQPALADRPVVLKVTRLGREEHLSLARLQHMNIVPLYSAQVLHDRRLQVLCMPFLGGASLAQVLETLKDQPPPARTGSQLIEALDGIQARLPVSLPARGPFRRYIASSPYVDAVCWIGVCLADGLHYAHERHFVHMDIKPSNVLLAGDAQPMLLDFHLAREPIEPGDAPPGWMGGTPGYMAPEQAEALTAVREGRPVLTAVDGRADLFSLGLLLYEALGGPAPRNRAGARPPLRRCNPRVPVGLSDILQKCLKPDPNDRYPDAGALAADLRRSLESLPLEGVPNRSVAQRWRNWRRRRPHALARSLLLLVSTLTALAAGVLLWTAMHQRVGEVESALAAGRAYLAVHQYADAMKSLRHGLALSANLPGAGHYRRRLGEELARARRDAKAADLHRLAELVRFRYGIDPPPPDEARVLLSRGRALWQARHLLLEPIPGRHEPEIDRTIRADLLDFALVWAALVGRSATGDGADQARREALHVLSEAAELVGPSPALERERQELSRPRGRAGVSSARTFAPRTAGEHCDLGRSFLRSGELENAAEQFRLGLGLRPQDFWLNFYQGLCAYRQGRFEEAVNAFRVCVALSPETAECFYNEALAENALGRTNEAIRDYTRALERTPELTEAALNRGILHYQAGRLGEAEADLNRALADASRRSDQGIIHYNLGLVHIARGDRGRALDHLDDADRLGHEGARSLADRLKREDDDRTRSR